jgi:hypothetical protein
VGEVGTRLPHIGHFAPAPTIVTTVSLTLPWLDAVADGVCTITPAEGSGVIARVGADSRFFFSFSFFRWQDLACFSFSAFAAASACLESLICLPDRVIVGMFTGVFTGDRAVVQDDDFNTPELISIPNLRLRRSRVS